MTRQKITIPVASATPKRTRGSQKMKSTPSKDDRTIIPERGIAVSSPKHGEIEKWLVDEIASLNWELFTEPPAQANAELVSSFLETVKKEKLPILTIQGVAVDFSSKEINEVYNTIAVEEDEDDELEKCLKRREDKAFTDEVLQTICTEGATWGTKESVPRRSLKFEAKVWMHFINSRLMPVTNDSRVNWERAVCVFCILTQRKFDVGRLIFKQLSVNAVKNQPFYFPCLVSELCKRAGLKPQESDVETVIPMAADIDQLTLKRIRENDGLESEAEEEKEERGKEKIVEEEAAEKVEEVVEASEKVAEKKLPRRKTTAKRGKPLLIPDEDTSQVRTMMGMGADLLALQVQAISDTIDHELLFVKSLHKKSEAEKLALQNELEQIKSAEPLPKKRKLEQYEVDQGAAEIKNTLNELVNNMNLFKKEIQERDAVHTEERNSWKEEIRSLREEMEKSKEREVELWKYIKERDRTFSENWIDKFRNHRSLPTFPDILPPEALMDAQQQGASEDLKKQ